MKTNNKVVVAAISELVIRHLPGKHDQRSHASGKNAHGNSEKTTKQLFKTGQRVQLRKGGKLVTGEILNSFADGKREPRYDVSVGGMYSQYKQSQLSRPKKKRMSANEAEIEWFESLHRR